MALIETLCNICSDMAEIIVKQSAVLSQFHALTMEREIEDVMARFNQTIGETPTDRRD